MADIRIHSTVPHYVSVRFEAERLALFPLSESIFRSFTEAQRKVHRDRHVEFDKEYYSVPPEQIGREAWLQGN